MTPAAHEFLAKARAAESVAFANAGNPTMAVAKAYQAIFHMRRVGRDFYLTTAMAVTPSGERFPKLRTTYQRAVDKTVFLNFCQPK